jgi:isoleucyl-tRNA synthetase
MARAYCAAHVTDNLVEWVGTLGVVSESGDLKIEYTTVAKKYAVEVLFVLHDLVNELLDQRQRLDDMHWS